MYYKCHVCNKTFHWASSRSRHAIVHRNISFQCDLCDKTFNRKDNLITHAQRVHRVDELHISSNSMKATCKNINLPLKTTDEEDQRENYNNKVSNVSSPREKYLSITRNKTQTNGELKKFAAPSVAPRKTPSIEEHVTKPLEKMKNEEVLDWDFETNPRDIVEAIRINMRLGVDFQIYINTLRHMGIIE